MSKHTEYVKVDFGDAEIAEFARDLARANRRKTSIEQQKKEVDSQLKADIEVENTTIQRLSEHIGNGFEYRNVDCRVDLDTPEDGKKSIVRIDTGEVIKVQPMSDMDRQMRLELKTAEETAANGGIPVAPAEATPVAEETPIAEAAVASSGPTLMPAVLAGGTHQQGTKKRRGARNPETEAVADGSAPDSDDTPF